MSITLFGTCRIDKINNNNNLNNDITYTHNTKELIQFIKYIKGEIKIDKPPYNQICFRTAIGNNLFIAYNDSYKKRFDDTSIFVIEICSNKKYIYKNYYLHHICVDKRFSQFHTNTPKEVLDNYKIEKQDDEEIENDILEIQKMLYPKKIIIISHYNSKINRIRKKNSNKIIIVPKSNGSVIPARDHLINLLNKICKKHKIPFINPTKVLSNYSQEDVMTDDLDHYKDLGFKVFTDYANNFIDKVLNSSKKFKSLKI